MNNPGLFIIGRILIPSVFVGLGLERLLVGVGVLAGASVSAGAILFSAFELIAGLLVMLGLKVRWVASLLALFILVDAFLAHAFWTYPVAERHGQLLHFLKNLSTLGVCCSSCGWMICRLPNGTALSFSNVGSAA